MEQASAADETDSKAALWMLLLLRLTDVTTDDRLELRNSKICFNPHVMLMLTYQQVLSRHY